MSAKHLLASAPTLERLEALVRKFYYNPTTLILHPDGSIETGSGVCSTRWEKVRKRFRFYSP